MADKTGIQWTDATWNPVRGCTRVSTGCGGPNHEGGCYAEKIAARFSGPGQPYEGFAERTRHGGRWTGRVALIPDKLTEPLTWRKPRRIFVNSMSDLFHEALPDEAIDQVFAIMALARQHQFQILTKRPDRARQYLLAEDRCDSIGMAQRGFDATATCYERLDQDALWPLHNVWLGTSVEDQETADERIPHLRATPAAVRFLSCEPLLGPLRIDLDGIDWVIIGGESGPNARPCDLAWIRSLRDQCRAADVPLFVKQLSSGGAKPIKEMEEFPEDLRVREFPEARS